MKIYTSKTGEPCDFYISCKKINSNVIVKFCVHRSILAKNCDFLKDTFEEYYHTYNEHMVTFHESRFCHDVVEGMLDLLYTNGTSTIFESTSLQMYLLAQAWDVKEKFIVDIKMHNIYLLARLYSTRMITTKEFIEYCEMYYYLKDSKLMSKIKKNIDVIHSKFDSKTFSLYFDKRYIDDHKDYFNKEIVFLGVKIYYD